MTLSAAGPPRLPALVARADAGGGRARRKPTHCTPRRIGGNITDQQLAGRERQLRTADDALAAQRRADAEHQRARQAELAKQPAPDLITALERTWFAPRASSRLAST